VIVKAQLSLYTSAARRQILIYTRYQSIVIQRDARPDDITAMGRCLKAFFTVSGVSKDGDITLIKRNRIRGQSW
jgi:hypothetical protein